MLSCIHIYIYIYTIIYIQYICTHVPNNKIKKAPNIIFYQNLEWILCDSSLFGVSKCGTPQTHCSSSMSTSEKEFWGIPTVETHPNITLYHIVGYTIVIYTINISISHIPMISPCPISQQSMGFCSPSRGKKIIADRLAPSIRTLHPPLKLPRLTRCLNRATFFTGKTYGFVWKCWVYSQWNSHLIGIMITNHWV